MRSMRAEVVTNDGNEVDDRNGEAQQTTDESNQHHVLELSRTVAAGDAIHFVSLLVKLFRQRDQM